MKSEIVDIGWGPKGTCLNVEVIPGRALRIFGTYGDDPVNKMFQIGDLFESGRYNLIYINIIVGITRKNIIYHEHDDTSRRKMMKMSSFVSANHNFDIERIQDHNAHMSMII